MTNKWLSKTTPPAEKVPVWVYGSDARGEFKQLAQRVNYKGRGARAFTDPNTKEKWRYLSMAGDYIKHFDALWWSYD